MKLMLLLYCLFVVGAFGLPFKLREIRSASEDALSCNTCFDVFNLAKEALHTSNQQKFTLSKVCSPLGNLNKACNEVKPIQINNVYQHIEEKLNTTEFCLIQQKCDSSSPINKIKVDLPEISIPNVTPNGDPRQLRCELCKGLMDQLQDTLLSDNKKQFQDALVKKCKENEELKNECETVVEISSSHIYDYFVDKLKLSATTCTVIGLCSGGPGPSAAVAPLPVITSKPHTVHVTPYPVSVVRYQPPPIFSPGFQAPDFSNVLAPFAAIGGALAGIGAAGGGIGLGAVLLG